MLCDNIEFAGVASNREVNNYKTKINSFRILVADDESSISDLFRQGLSRINTDANVQSKTRRSNEKLSFKILQNYHHHHLISLPVNRRMRRLMP